MSTYPGTPGAAKYKLAWLSARRRAKEANRRAAQARAGALAAVRADIAAAIALDPGCSAHAAVTIIGRHQAAGAGQ